ncbi:MAG TPA: cysteine--tRNA ligase, partial [Verrucomicrobiae bacterium]|nr:cysteine--tRNA ligase [Verrucomicrobiae bacterium]
TLSRSVVAFAPADPAGKAAGMYCCGPTVHNFAHIGNFRTFVCTDFVRRYLTFRGYTVRHVMNITDVEDKIIAAVKESGRSLKEYTAEYERAFLEDFDALNCLRPQEMPHATDFIPEIVQLIESLVRRGFAYLSSDRSVYFSIEKYRAAGRKYGQLLNLNFEELRVGERVSSDEYAKESVADFALWKARVPDDGMVFWASPWGEGRPGWHIECSAMSMKLLGPSFDLHLGGEDLVFPHHEDEIAQSEGSGAQPEGQPFVKHWLHVAHLLVEGRKMSKSLGNFFTLRDLLAKGFAGREIRYLLLSSHYRESFNFTLGGLAGARTALARIDEFASKLRGLAGSEQSAPYPEVLQSCTDALDDDLNVAAAWGHIFEWVRATNKSIADARLSPVEAASHLAAWEHLDSLLGVGNKADSPEASPDLLALLEERQTARKSKNFARADQIRDELKDRGWTIEDTSKGPKLKRI